MLPLCLSIFCSAFVFGPSSISLVSRTKWLALIECLCGHKKSFNSYLLTASNISVDRCNDLIFEGSVYVSHNFSLEQRNGESKQKRQIFLWESAANRVRTCSGRPYWISSPIQRLNSSPITANVCQFLWADLHGISEAQIEIALFAFTSPVISCHSHRAHGQDKSKDNRKEIFGSCKIAKREKECYAIDTQSQHVW